MSDAEAHVVETGEALECEGLLLLADLDRRLGILAELEGIGLLIVVDLFGTVLAVAAHHEGPIVLHRQLQTRGVVVAAEGEDSGVVAWVNWDRQLG